MSSEAVTHGYWGPRTATIDWCESNYEITFYIAEFWNTISNLIMIIFPLYSVYWSYKHVKFAENLKKTSPTRFNQQFYIPVSVVMCQLGLALVGVGSWCFHMTLLYSMQLLDELPMIYGSAILIYSEYDLLLSIKESLGFSISKRLPSRPVVGTLIFLYCLTVTFVYLSVWKNPVFHEIAYALMVFVIIFESFYLIKALKVSKLLYLTSLGYYALGFLFWNLDNHFCEYLKSSKNFLQSFLGLDGSDNFRSIFFNVLVVLVKSVFEFHSWWHLFTGYAAYMTILFIIDLNYRLHLKVTSQEKIFKKKETQPVDCKYRGLYYFLTNRLIHPNDQEKVF